MTWRPGEPESGQHGYSLFDQFYALVPMCCYGKTRRMFWNFCPYPVSTRHHNPDTDLGQNARNHFANVKAAPTDSNPLFTEKALPHYILEESNLNVRYIWL